MVNIKEYLSSNFTKAFLTIFLPFFMIISLIYLVRIATMTAQIQVTFPELLLLYSYSLPEIVFYTLPLSFVSAIANVLIKLSQDNELIALYALGLPAKKILKSLLLLGFLFSLLLLAISLLAMPLSKQYFKAFKQKKASEAKLNIVAGELGQKFGDYYIYVKEKRGKILYDVVIYNRKDKDNEQFFSAKTGELRYKNSISSLFLTDGYGYTYSTLKLQESDYKTLEVFDSVENSDYHFESVWDYWGQSSKNSDIMHKFLFFTFISFIPWLSVYMVASFSMINPRYQTNRSFLVVFLTTIFFYIIATSLRKWGDLPSLFLSILGVAIVGQWLFAKRVSRFF